VRNGQLGALLDHVARPDPVALEAVHCRTAGQLLGVGIFRASWRRQTAA